MKDRQVGLLSHFFTQSILDNKGRTVAVVEANENDETSRLILRFKTNLPMLSMVLHLTIKEAVKRINFRKEDIITQLTKNNVASEESIMLLDTAIQAYFDEKYIEFMHIAIPQIEAILRDTLHYTGGNIQKLSKDGKIYNLITLDEILRSEELNKIFDESILIQFRCIYTDPRGYNLRNDIFHGLATIESFSALNSALVMHTIIWLGHVIITSKEEQNND